MDIKLQGHKNRRQKALETYMKFKELNDRGLAIDEILKEVTKPDGTCYTRAYFYYGLKVLKNI